LTRHGCTQGACHGSAAGRGGLRFSLLGGDPESDFTTIVHSANGRLVAGATPDDTLILKKASGQLNHGGGERIARGSQAYATLKAWLLADMPQPTDTDVIKDIRIASNVSNLQPGASTPWMMEQPRSHRLGELLHAHQGLQELWFALAGTPKPSPLPCR
jgi:mono/diheme cytochrome c family protein